VLFDRDQHENKPFGSKALRECYARAQRRSGWDKRNPAPRSMRDGSDLVGFGMATGIWEALQVPITVRIVLTRQRPRRGGVRDLRHRTGTYTIMAQVAATCGSAARQQSASSSATRACRNRRSKADRGLRPQCRTGS